MTDIQQYSEHTFEQIKHIDEYGNEYWYARELQLVLEYKQWRRFLEVVIKAKEACENSGFSALDHFAEYGKMIETGKGAQREIEDIKLTRYACYLIVQNANPRKKSVALGQTYFAVQTRKQELSEAEDFSRLDEDERRLLLRGSVKDFNKKLADTAHDAGVKNYGRFQNFGYQGLYDGENAADIKRRKGLTGKQEILDHMGSTELAANYFRITQTEEKIRKENIKGENTANNTHYKVGRIVRRTMLELSGTAPEELPTPAESIRAIEKRQKQALRVKKPKK